MVPLLLKLLLQLPPLLLLLLLPPHHPRGAAPAVATAANPRCSALPVPSSIMNDAFANTSTAAFSKADLSRVDSTAANYNHQTAATRRRSQTRRGRSEVRKITSRAYFLRQQLFRHMPLLSQLVSDAADANSRKRTPRRRIHLNMLLHLPLREWRNLQRWSCCRSEQKCRPCWMLCCCRSKT